MNKVEKRFNANSFAEAVEKLVRDESLDYLEAIMEVCERNDLEPEAAATIIKKSDVIRSKLEATCRHRRILPKVAELPLQEMY